MKAIFKKKKVIFLFILVALAGVISIYLTVGRLKTFNVQADNMMFSKDGFVEAEELTGNDVLVGSNNRFELYFNEQTTHFYIKDVISNKAWYSSPQGEDDLATPETKNLQNSTLVVYYAQGDNLKHYNNFKYSIAHENGEKAKTYSVKYLNNAVQVLYQLIDNTIDYTWFPEYLSAERMDELFGNTDKLSEKEFKWIKERYYELNEEGVYELTPYEDMSTTYVDNLYRYMYETELYNREELVKDNDEFNRVINFDNPIFEVAVEYRLTEKGLKAAVINDSIVEDPKYPITAIDFLPYFGATTLEDEGYFVIPDGSGAIMNFNNGKTYADPYSKRYYGDDLALQKEIKPETAEDLLLPVYGIVKTNKDDSLLAIIEKGAPLSSLYAHVSNRIDEYNRINLKFILRESEVVIFANRGEVAALDIWTKKHAQNDFIVNYQVISGENADYVGLAKTYQQYLVNNQGFEKTDDTKQTVMNLKLLGMYEKREFILGVPYNATKTLTTFDEAQEILDELDTRDINNINLIYEGWFNDGMDHKVPTKIKINSVMGGEEGFNSLLKYTKDNQIAFYPSMNIMKVNQFNKKFDSIRYTSRHVDGRTSIVNRYELSTSLMLYSSTQDYVLSPDLYHSLVTKMLTRYDDLNLSGITLNDLGSEMSGDYRKYQEIFRDEDQMYQKDALDLINEDYQMLLYAPYGYAISYASSILNLPQESSKYPIFDSSIPFYQLVLNGYKDYAGLSINTNVEKNLMYSKLKAIETGSNISYIWSYKDSSVLLETNYNYYYSTNYRNWVNGAEQLIGELDNLGIHNNLIINHEVLTNGVYKVTYDNGQIFIINYNPTIYQYTDELVVLPNNYLMMGR